MPHIPDWTESQETNDYLDNRHIQAPVCRICETVLDKGDICEMCQELFEGEKDEDN